MFVKKNIEKIDGFGRKMLLSSSLQESRGMGRKKKKKKWGEQWRTAIVGIRAVRKEMKNHYF